MTINEKMIDKIIDNILSIIWKGKLKNKKIGDILTSSEKENFIKKYWEKQLEKFKDFSLNEYLKNLKWKTWFPISFEKSSSSWKVIMKINPLNNKVTLWFLNYLIIENLDNKDFLAKDDKFKEIWSWSLTSIAFISLLSYWIIPVSIITAILTKNNVIVDETWSDILDRLKSLI
jgi:hypothetical protein